MKRVLLAIVMVLGMTQPASAQAAAASDPEDVSGGLDIVFIERSENPGGPLELQLRTEDIVRCRFLKKSKDTQLKWLFDTKGGKSDDYVGRFKCHREELLFFLRASDGSSQFEPLPVERPNRRTFRVSMPTDIFEGNKFYVWAKSIDGEKCDPECVDRAPDNGYL